MTLKVFNCRDHGGVFKMPPRRGRPPVRCNETNPCTKADQAEIAANKITSVVREVPGVGKVAVVTTTKAPESIAEALPAENPSLPLAMDAKGQLTALGWQVAGKAKGTSAQVTATRGAETLIMVWSGGELKAQDYSLSYVKPSDNGVPAHSLSFEPDELTNSELVQILRGMKVTWWNTLGNSTESATVGNKVSIEHIYDDDREKRIVKFIAHDGGGFRAFHVAALLKVG